ncbi:hypothetical protein [Sphingomonas sp. UYEF23]|uniref:hypothetical protein n=1 Tax=Sphingomonas sp. UYEF23 TaxID=1756408 RepID=UPI00339B7029
MLRYVLQSADETIFYQTHLNRVAQLGMRPKVNPVLGIHSDWRHSEVTTLAQREIHTTVASEALLGSTHAPFA